MTFLLASGVLLLLGGGLDTPPPPAPLSLLMSVQEPQHLDVEVCLAPEMWQDA